MKLLIIIIFCLLNTALTHAQTLSEWFQQKKTQEKYLIEQIAGLKVYAGYMKKGYEVFDKGSKTISEIKNEDFNMHRIFFDAREKLNPKLSNFVEHLGIESLKNAIKNKGKQLKHFVWETSSFSEKQKNYFSSVIGKTDREADELFDNYKELITANELTMDDAERLKHLTDLKREYLSLYQFINLFDNQIRGYSQQLKIERNDISTTKKILGLNP